jgi:hypothetical protein
MAKRETITIPQAAAALGLSIKSIYRFAHEGCLGREFADEHGWAALDLEKVKIFAGRLDLKIPPRATIGRPRIKDTSI